MHIVIAGSTGLIGSALCRHLMNEGHRVRRLVRPDTFTAPNHAPQGTLVHWDPQGGTIDMRGLEGADAVINLAGENIVGWWTDAKKQRILQSRVNTTRLLAESLPKMLTPPRVFINGSAVGYYGDRGDQTLHECSESGGGFLAEVCRRWEAATEPAQGDDRIRVIRARLGNVLTPEGGLLKKMLTPFYLGLGGKLGPGTQWMPWITLPEVCHAMTFLMEHDAAGEGAFNFVGPQPATNAEFTKTLGRVLRRPALGWMPGTMLEAVLGEFGKHALMSQRVVPQRLNDAGYDFVHPDLETGLRGVLMD